MKKVAIGFVVGLAVGVASTVIGLRGYANDPLVPQEYVLPIPEWWQIIFLALKGSAVIWLFAFLLGLLLVAINFVWWEMVRRKKG